MSKAPILFPKAIIEPARFSDHIQVKLQWYIDTVFRLAQWGERLPVQVSTSPQDVGKTVQNWDEEDTFRSGVRFAHF